jgi:hypothetical protein
VVEHLPSECSTPEARKKEKNTKKTLQNKQTNKAPQNRGKQTGRKEGRKEDVEVTQLKSSNPSIQASKQPCEYSKDISASQHHHHHGQSDRRCGRDRTIG